MRLAFQRFIARAVRLLVILPATVVTQFLAVVSSGARGAWQFARLTCRSALVLLPGLLRGALRWRPGYGPRHRQPQASAAGDARARLAGAATAKAVIAASGRGGRPHRAARAVSSLGLAAIAVAWLTVAGTAPACACGLVLRARALTERALVTYHAGTETIVPGLSVTRVGPDAAVLLPVPGVPRVRVLHGVDHLFSELESATARRQPALARGEAPRARASSPGVGAHRIIGDYAISVLRANGVAGLQAWLGRYGYALPSAARPILQSYARQHWRFVAIRLAGQRSDQLRPLAISFRTKRIVYPMRLAAVGSAPVSLELFVDASGVAYPSGVPLGLAFAGSVRHLAPRLSPAVRALLPGRFLTRLEASGISPRLIHGDVVLGTRVRGAFLTDTTGASDGICGLCVLAPSGTSLTDTGNGAFAVNGSSIVVDSAAHPAVSLTGNAKITAPSVGVVGTVSNTGHGTINNLTTGIKPCPTR